jgi:perosamine synthetase
MRKSITPGTSAAIVPHSFGFPAQMDKIVDLGIPVVEDCATSIGARYRGQPVGSFSLISAYSFYATKMLTTGEGGMIITDDWDVAQLVRELRDYTGRSDFRIRYNYKMTDISAALGIAQLKKLDEFIQRRTALAAQYTSLLMGHSSFILPEYDRNEVEPNFYRYLVRLTDGDAEEVRLAMKEKGIICGKAVLHPLHRLLRLPAISYPNCEKLANEVISLPIYPLLTSGEVTFICHEFLRILENKR